MKNKLIILSLMVLLVASGAFAQVTFSGQIQFEGGSSLQSADDDGYKDYGIYDADVQLQANIKADDFNTGTIRMRWRTAGPQGPNGQAIGFDKAFFASDIGKAFQLPIGWVSMVGMDYWLMTPKASDRYMTLLRIIPRTAGSFDPKATSANHGITDNYNLRFFDDPLWGTKQVFTFADGMFTLSGFFSFSGESKFTDGTGNYLGVNNNVYRKAGRLRDFWVDANVAAPAGPGKVNFAVAYLVYNNVTRHPYANAFIGRDEEKDPATTAIGLGEGYVQIAPSYLGLKDVIPGATLDFGFSYWLAMKKQTGTDMMAFNAQANFDGNKGYALVGFQGYPVKNDKRFGEDAKAQPFHNVRAAFGYKPVDAFGLDLGVILYTGGEDKYENGPAAGDDRKLLNSLDFSAALYVGKTEFRLGYLFVPKEDISIQPLHNLAGGQDMTRSCLYLISTLRF